MTDSLRIYMWVRNLGNGGAERVCTHLASEFSRAGHDVTLFTDLDDNPYAAELDHRVQLKRLKGSLAGRIIRMAWHLRRARPDVLFATGYMHNLAGLLAGLFSGTGTPVIIREVNTTSRQLKVKAGLSLRAAFVLSRLLYPRAFAVVAPSQGVRDDLSQHMPRLRDRLHVIPNPVDRDDIRRQMKDPLPQAPARFIMSAGRLDVQKGYDVLIRAWADTYPEYPVDLVILGEGPLRHSLEMVAEERNLRDHLHLPGFDINPYRWMHQAQAFILSSRFEGLPNVLLQAMACGTPVIATDCESGPREILEGGKGGLLVPVDDVNALRQALCDVLRGPAGESALPAHYDPRTVAAAWISIFKQSGK